MPGFEIFGDEERKEINDVTETGVLFRYGFDAKRNGHWKARSFEEEIREKTGVRFAHACSSGTAALHIALQALSIGAFDEVILPPFTFVATFEAVLATGAVPVFAEIDDTLCISVKGIEKALTPKTKAVMMVHMCGSMARVDEIKDFCEKKGLILIEDTCQAIGGTYKGKSLGTFGRMGCFSFDAVKTVTCGEGGAVITNDETLSKKADQFADHGHDHIGNDRGLEEHPVTGFNYRISELNAAVGLAQIRKLDKIIAVQRSHKAMIKDSLKKIPGVSFRTVPDEAGDSATFLSFFLESEDKARKAAKRLAEEGVTGCFYYYDNNWHYLRKWEHFQNLSSPAILPQKAAGIITDYNTVSLPESDGYISRNISMQIMLSWTEDDIKQRIEKMKKVLSE